LSNQQLSDLIEQSSNYAATTPAFVVVLVVVACLLAASARCVLVTTTADRRCFCSAYDPGCDVRYQRQMGKPAAAAAG